MSNYNANSPADDETIANGPADIRTNQEALRTDGIVNAGTLNGLASGNTTGLIPVSNGNVNANLNADKLDGKEAADFANASHDHAAATGSSNGFMSNTDKQKLDGIAAGAEVDQNAFSNVLVGSTTVQSASKTGTLEIVPGKNIAVTPDDVNKRLTFAVTGKVDSAAIADTLSQALPVALGGTGLTGGAAPAGCGLGGAGTRLAGGYDLNNLKANGWYDVCNPTNGVSGLTWHKILVVCSGDTGYVTQLAFGMTENYNLVWTRTLHDNSTWTSWVRLANIGDIPSSLPANGGNADTVDGKHASDFAPNTALTPYGAYTGDLNNAGTGFYSVDFSVCTSTPPADYSYGTLVCYRTYSGEYGSQTQIFYTHGNSGQIWFRRKWDANAWSAWKQIATVDQIPAATSHGKQLFTSSGTFTVPTGVTTIYVSMCGPGGNGGTGSNGSHSGNGGGAGAAITVTVGTSSGATSSFGSYVTCNSGSNGENSPLTRTSAGGSGGSGLFGIGGLGGTRNETNGLAGTGYGSGGAGTSGMVLVEW